MSYLDFQKTPERLMKSGKGIRRSGKAFLSYGNHSLQEFLSILPTRRKCCKGTLYVPKKCFR